jgi:hypothetical protein
MPVILARERYAEWLTSDEDGREIRTLLTPFDAALMKRYRVSTLVNRTENDRPECAEEAVVGQTLELWGQGHAVGFIVMMSEIAIYQQSSGSRIRAVCSGLGSQRNVARHGTPPWAPT